MNTRQEKLARFGLRVLETLAAKHWNIGTVTAIADLARAEGLATREGFTITRPRPAVMLDTRPASINGVQLTLGLCCLCGRSLSLSTCNTIGPRCRYEGAQYDRAGRLLYDASDTPQTRRMWKIKARAVYSHTFYAVALKAQ